MVKHRLYIAGIALIMSLCSCNQDIIADHTWELSPDHWHHSHVLEDSWNLTDSSKYYRLYLNLDHSNEFAYQNLYLKLQLESPQSQIIDETTSIQLMDVRTTQWIGEQKGSELIHLKTTIRDSLLLKDDGQYHIVIGQYSRDSLLQGIDRIGFELEALSP
ncbi:gliding motility lipoprotein GldH [Membranihabitans marinus]|uniref:gliding motility lipoprotein GldH n=1 Tax=Membranihabitans marinus TaxID=1227546 RepID=UPI001F3488C1|nr:gliding motility lipoprotein GldH [Membranihabitans marinus]